MSMIGKIYNIVLLLLVVRPISFLRKSSIPLNNVVKNGSILIKSRLGMHNYVGVGVILNDVTVGSFCSIAPGVFVGGAEHNYKQGSTSSVVYSVTESSTTFIQDDVWIGANVFVRQGVILGKGSVIAAGSVVLKNVDPYTIVAGNPARFIRDRFPRAVKAELMEVEFSALSPAELRLTLDHIVLHK